MRRLITKLMLATTMLASAPYNVFQGKPGDANKSELEHVIRETEIASDPMYMVVYDALAAAKKDRKIPSYITPEFIRDIIRVESSDNPRAVSRVGATGLMQLTNPTWNDLTNMNYSHASNPETNVKFGTEYLAWIGNYCKNHMPNWDRMPVREKRKYVAASYNGGPSWICNQKKRPWRETRDYVRKLGLQ